MQKYFYSGKAKMMQKRFFHNCRHLPLVVRLVKILLGQIVQQVYNEGISQIAVITDLKAIEPLTFRLQCEWNVATKDEQMICKEKVDEACK